MQDISSENTLSIEFRTAENFKRPWPHGKRDLIAKGNWYVGQGTNEQTGLIEVRIDGGIPKIYVSDGEARNSESTRKVRPLGIAVDGSEAEVPPHLRLLDDAWLQERIRELTADP